MQCPSACNCSSLVQMDLQKNKPFGSVAFFLASSICFNCFSFASFSSLASFSASYLAAEDERKRRGELEEEKEEEKDKEEEKEDDNDKERARGREGGGGKMDIRSYNSINMSCGIATYKHYRW